MSNIHPKSSYGKKGHINGGASNSNSAHVSRKDKTGVTGGGGIGHPIYSQLGASNMNHKLPE